MEDPPPAQTQVNASEYFFRFEVRRPRDMLDYKSTGTILGRGSFGEVVLMRHRSEDGQCRDVAVKCISLQELNPSEKQEAAKNAHKEMTLSQRAKEALNVVPIFDAWYDDTTETIHLAMDAGNASLMEYRNSDPGRFSQPGIFGPIVMQIAAAVKDIHAAGVVHRDLKPQNIIVKYPSNERDPLTVRVIDFGLSVLTGDETAGRGAGTRAYMAPENYTGARGTVILEKLDIWSLGVIIVLLVTGRLPKIEWSDVNGERRVCISKVDSNRRRLSSEAEAVLEVASRMLVYRPESRPSAEEVYRSLFECLKHRIPPELLRRMPPP